MIEFMRWTDVLHALGPLGIGMGNGLVGAGAGRFTERTANTPTYSAVAGGSTSYSQRTAAAPGFTIVDDDADDTSMSGSFDDAGMIKRRLDDPHTTYTER